jgi:hypothetical protein
VQVIQDAYEYHGLNELRWYFLFAVLTNAVLFMHWSGSTATFKHNVQVSGCFWTEGGGEIRYTLP